MKRLDPQLKAKALEFVDAGKPVHVAAEEAGIKLRTLRTILARRESKPRPPPDRDDTSDGEVSVLLEGDVFATGAPAAIAELLRAMRGGR